MDTQALEQPIDPPAIRGEPTGLMGLFLAIWRNFFPRPHSEVCLKRFGEQCDC
jgi:hypothetical protein